MKINDCVKLALCYLDMSESSLSNSATLNKFLASAKTVFNVINAQYLSVGFSEKVELVGNKLLFSSLSKKVAKVIAVKQEGKQMSFSLYSDYALIKEAVGVVEVDYTFYIEELTLEDEVPLQIKVTPQMVAFGIASEVCIINSDYEKSSIFEQKFKESLKNMNSSKGDKKIKGRLWY